jgi:methionyl-tRNA formyltransferase
MHVVLLANNRVASEVACCIRDQGDDIVALVLHPAERRKFGDEIIRASDVTPSAIYDGTRINDPKILAALAAHAPDIGVSVSFGYLLRRPVLDLFPRGCVNLHPAFLPYNRGANPNIWSIVDRTPAGVTIHYIDEGVDTGDIIAQTQIPVEVVDTGETLYHKLEQASTDLFRRTWPSLRVGDVQRRPQAPGQGSVHRLRDVERIDEIDLDRTYTGRELIDILRARTFLPYPGAFFRVGGKKIYLRLQLLEDELPPSPHAESVANPRIPSEEV